MRLLLGMLTFTFCFAQVPSGPHPHIKSASWLESGSVLEWRTEEYDNKEKPLAKPEDYYFISLPDATMTSGKETRRFTTEEAQLVNKALHSISSYIATSIAPKIIEPAALPPTIVEVSWYPITGNIQIAIQAEPPLGLVQVRIDDTGHTFWTDGEEVHKGELEEELKRVLWINSAAVIRYVGESTYWWRDGQGEIVVPDKKQASH